MLWTNLYGPFASYARTHRSMRNMNRVVAFSEFDYNGHHNRHADSVNGPLYK